MDMSYLPMVAIVMISDMKPVHCLTGGKKCFKAYGFHEVGVGAGGENLALRRGVL